MIDHTMKTTKRALVSKSIIRRKRLEDQEEMFLGR